jgi:glycosyltransferase involved in cell wall biosynthesis
MECARRIGLPSIVPVIVNYLPVFGPDDAAGEGITLPWERNTSFTIGFAGLFSEQKGWKVLLAAMERLPERYKAVFAGDGPQNDELLVSIKRLQLQSRVHCAGLLPRERLLATYPLFDIFVLPSVTLAYSVEQFGCALAEAMACGVPVIGSDSGAIPEVVGEGGLIFPEGDVDALAKAIVRMSEDNQLRKSSITWGFERYRSHYSCEAYARSIAEMLGIN